MLLRLLVNPNLGFGMLNDKRTAELAATFLAYTHAEWSARVCGGSRCVGTQCIGLQFGRTPLVYCIDSAL